MLASSRIVMENPKWKTLNFNTHSGVVTRTVPKIYKVPTNYRAGPINYYFGNHFALILI